MADQAKIVGVRDLLKLFFESLNLRSWRNHFVASFSERPFLNAPKKEKSLNFIKMSFEYYYVIFIANSGEIKFFFKLQMRAHERIMNFADLNGKKKERKKGNEEGKEEEEEEEERE